MNYKKITEADIHYFQSVIGTENVIFDKDKRTIYGSDQTENLNFEPELILLPTSTPEVSEIVQYCYRENICITPRSAGTGLAGGALPIYGGIILSIEKINQEILVDPINFQVTVDAGVINYNLQEKLGEYGLFFPPDPSSWQSSLIGGNIATNAGGPRAVKYGVTAQYVLNLEVVLPNGEIIWTGANTLKNSTGYNLTQLMVGSEGTLGIVTKAVLKVMPKPDKDISLLMSFKDINEAILAVNTIINAGLNPCGIELMEKKAIQIAKSHIDNFPLEIKDDIEAVLFIMFDGNNAEKLMEEAVWCSELLTDYKIDDIILADNETDKNRIWQLRRKVAEIVKAHGWTIEEDTVVPRGEMAKLIQFVHQLTEKNNCTAVCYGHAGDGNLHVRINHPHYKNSYNQPEIQNMLKELFTYIKTLGGTISGEHGIGLIQKDFLPIVLHQTNIDIQKKIKEAFDPKNIMNPGKIW